MLISVINHKGGVGKTCISTNLGHALANRGKKVLLVDCDAQCNSSSIFAPTDNMANPKTLYDVYANNIPVDQCIYSTPYENVDILMNSTETSHLEIDLYQDVRTSYQLLKDKLRDYANEHYDIVLLDNSPSLGIFSIMSLVASDCAIVPIEAGCRYSLDGFVAALDAIQSIADRVNHNLKFLKAVINKSDARTSISRVSIDHIRRQFTDKVFETAINQDTKIKEAVALKITVLRHAPSCTASKKFRALADEVIGLL